MSQRPKANSTARVLETTLLDLVVRESDARLEGVVIGRLASVDADGAIYVEFPGTPLDAPTRAASFVAVGVEQVGQRVGIQFEFGSQRHPIIIGFLRDRTDVGGSPRPALPKRVLVEATEEVELRCGDCSIVLQNDGKLRVRGRDLLTRASGSHRIKGGSVQIN